MSRNFWLPEDTFRSRFNPYITSLFYFVFSRSFERVSRQISSLLEALRPAKVPQNTCSKNSRSVFLNKNLKTSANLFQRMLLWVSETRMAMNVATGIGTDVFTHAQDTQQHLKCDRTQSSDTLHSNQWIPTNPFKQEDHVKDRFAKKKYGIAPSTLPVHFSERLKENRRGRRNIDFLSTDWQRKGWPLTVDWT